MILDCKSEINLICKLNIDLRLNTDICNNMQLLNENISSGFDRNMVQLIKDNNFRVGQYLQSWKYFDTISGKLRKQLIFRDHIDRNSRGIVKNILLKRNLTLRSTISLKTRFISDLQFTMIFIFFDIAIPNTEAN
jgi:hypothetical protein